jgi:hypothetical protein
VEEEVTMNPFKRKAEESPSRVPNRKQPKRFTSRGVGSTRFTSELTTIRHDYELPSPSTSPDFVVQINELEESLQETLHQVLPSFTVLWTQLTLQVVFRKDPDSDQHFWLILPKQFIYQEEEIEQTVHQMLQDAKVRIERQELRGSGLRFINIERVELAVSKYRPLQGSSYLPIPKELANKKCLINVQNDDDSCFKWALLSALFPAPKDAQRVSKYQAHQDRINLNNIPLLVPLDKTIF